VQKNLPEKVLVEKCDSAKSFFFYGGKLPLPPDSVKAGATLGGFPPMPVNLGTVGCWQNPVIE
jgi:hypothetical protein